MVEQVVITTEPTGSEAPKADEGAAGDRPVGLPDNFKSTEELAKSYTELQGELTKSKQTIADSLKAPAADAAAGDANPTKIPDANEGTGDAPTFAESLQGFSQEYQETGVLADESYEALEELGLPKQIVDGYIAGQQSIQTGVETTLFNAAGGKESYGEMTAWAVEGLNTDETTAFNKAIDSGDVQTAIMAIENLSTKFAAANGTAPNLVRGDNTRAGQDGSMFRSWKEVTTAMGDKRYQSDPAYTQDVQEKLGRSAL